MTDAPDRAAVEQAVRARVAARRERHRQRPLVVRVLAAIGGFLTCLVGAVLIWAPELALPLLLVGFGLLALEFDWATKAQIWTELRITLIRARLKRQPTWLKAVLVVLAVLFVGVAVWLALAAA
ncbi:hypothetical protein GCM10010172_72870 [Paractinoplanes ferrugineus]|uniref:TIGR02611 family protein n=1 Tax=Paractinoplanes ferrugineus TaxID=113564 RepID=A0A919J0C2_9ACTN|nr:hypothetical protein [Actinoplanes ferrugineus]GIE11558.1 hypothetical protein Afe05nite_33980 [Actinoplanes ferrugineus]